METFIGKPHVYTIDVNNLDLVEVTITEIMSLEVSQFSVEQTFELHSFTDTKPLLSSRTKTCCCLSLYGLPLLLFVCLFFQGKTISSLRMDSRRHAGTFKRLC